MQDDIIKHKTPHTEDNCRACRALSPTQRRLISERRTLRLIEDVKNTFLRHRHTFKRVVTPGTEDDNGRVLEGGSYETCTYQDCAVIREFV